MTEFVMWWLIVLGVVSTGTLIRIVATGRRPDPWASISDLLAHDRRALRSWLWVFATLVVGLVGLIGIAIERV